MNILPKKNWHVRNHENMERVRRDEEKAAAAEKEEQRRIALAEQEARTALLRKRSQLRLKSADHDSDSADKQLMSSAPQPSGHINFFADLESTEKNREYEADKKAEQEKREKAIGLLTYLGQSAAESQTVKPWYQELPRRLKKRKRSSSGSSSEHENAKERSRKQRLDPLRTMPAHCVMGPSKPETSATRKRRLIEVQTPAAQKAIDFPKLSCTAEKAQKRQAENRHKASRKRTESRTIRARRRSSSTSESDSTSTFSDSSSSSSTSNSSTDNKKRTRSKRKGRRRLGKQTTKQSSDSSETSSSSSSDSSDNRKRRISDKKKKRRRTVKKRAKSRNEAKEKKVTTVTHVAAKVAHVTTQQTKSIAQLRAERIAREESERKRSEQLVRRLREAEAAARGEGSPAARVMLNDRERPYNSQFNPDFVRKPKFGGDSTGRYFSGDAKARSHGGDPLFSKI